MYDDILKYFPKNIYEEIQKGLDEEELLEEIRLRNNRPLILKFSNKEKILKKSVNTNEILETLEHICDNSIYSYQAQIREGFIRIIGKSRIKAKRMKTDKILKLKLVKIWEILSQEV